jgi:hypothetical protein
VRAGGLWECRSVSVPDATQNGAPPPPPPPTGSPFGRFLTQPVFLVALLALIVSAPIVALVLKGDDGGSAAAPTVLGDWSGPATAPNAEGPVDVELTIRSLSGGDDGTLTRGRCSGALTSRGRTGSGYLFAYEERADPEGCPRSAAVVVEPLAGDRLRFVERRAGRILAEGVLGGA